MKIKVLNPYIEIPSRAKYIARDSDYNWYFFENKPILMSRLWDSNCGWYQLIGATELAIPQQGMAWDKSLTNIKSPKPEGIKADQAMLTLVRGLPGSGKSTIAKALAKDFHVVHVELDMFFMRNGIYKFECDKLEQAEAWCKETTRCFLNSGIPVVVSNTFAKLCDMGPYFEMARVINFEIQILTATEYYPNIHGVSDGVVSKIRESWELLEYSVEFPVGN